MAALGSIAYEARGGKSARPQTGWKLTKAYDNRSATFSKYLGGTIAKWGFRPFQKTIGGGQLSFTVTLTAGGTAVADASVALYERSSRQLVEVKRTNGSGYVIFGDLNQSYKYTAVAIHPDAIITYNASRHDGLTPT